jgi:hypothetical protein
MVPLGLLLLINITMLCDMLACMFRKKWQDKAYVQLDKNLSTFVYFVRVFSAWFSGLYSPNLILLHITLALAADFYFKNKDKDKDLDNDNNLFFYLFAVHGLTLFKIAEHVDSFEVLYLSIAAHVVGFFQQIYLRLYHYTPRESSVDRTEFVTLCCYAVDMVILYSIYPTNSMIVWKGVLELYSMFMLFYLESFGKMTYSVTSLLFLQQPLTVAKMIR